jgi:L-aspartate oxidase
VLRSETSLAGTGQRLASLAAEESDDPCTETWEATNLHAVASFLVAAAHLREETRGSHWREDFPDRDDERWGGRLVGRLTEGRLDLTFQPIEET